MEAVQNDCILCRIVWENSHHQSQYIDLKRYKQDLSTTLRLYKRADGEGLRILIAFRGQQLLGARLETKFQLLPINCRCYATDIFEMEAVLSNIAGPKTKHYFTDPQLQSKTSSSATMNLAFRWYQSCHSNHDMCNSMKTQRISWMPTRLLDIGGESEAQWKLVVVSEDNITPAPYVTLSYRWGSNQSLLLQSSTFSIFRQGQLISHLPQTFKDAVAVARRFLVRYLWIDALCIIQDSSEDMAREIPAMQHIYSNSACTLAASASENPNGGLFRTRDITTVVPGVIKAPPGALENEDHYLFDNTYWNRHIFSGPLHKRGWVFQERLLSPRVVYFTKTQILWECLTDVKCEGFPQGIPEHQSMKNLYPLWDVQEECSQDKQQSKKMPTHILRLWNSLVREYSSCMLTMASDKLPAFGGIANLFAEVTGDLYVAGMWRPSLLEQLDWWVDQPCTKISTEHRAPSWSWASLDGPIRPRHEAARTRHLVSISAVTSNKNRNGLTDSWCDANLHLLGGLTPSTELKQSLKAILYPDNLETNFGESIPFYFLPLQTSSYELLPDNLDDNNSGFCTEVSCLLLKAVSCGKPNAFRRVGQCVLDDKEDTFSLGLCIEENGFAYWNNCDASTVIIL